MKDEMRKLYEKETGQSPNLFHLSSITTIGYVAWLEKKQDATLTALDKLWKHTAKIDNGRCAVCRIGYVQNDWTKDLVNPTVTPCDNADCLSHVVRQALASAKG